jgi:hypothetical protein
MSADRRSPESRSGDCHESLWDVGSYDPDAGPASDTGLPSVVEPAQRYAVRDTTGRLWATLVREPDKVFWWEGPDGRPGLGDVSVVDLPLYGSERLRRVPLETAVIVTEGPKDCQAVWRAHMPAVATVTGAAATPSITVLEALRDRIVILWPDNDEPGVRHMEKLAEALDGIAREVRWLAVPGLPGKAGAADVPTAEISRLVASYARVMRPRVSNHERPLREKGEISSLLQERLGATYAGEVGTARYSRREAARLRALVGLRFDAPSDAALRELRDVFERISGRLARPRQIDYLIRCYRIHGPETARLLIELYRERGATENLLLALELAAPVTAATDADDVSLTGSPSASEPDPLPGSAGDLAGWHCYFDLGSGHVPERRADGSVFCGTCHPRTVR